MAGRKRWTFLLSREPCKASEHGRQGPCYGKRFSSLGALAPDGSPAPPPRARG